MYIFYVLKSYISLILLLPFLRRHMYSNKYELISLMWFPPKVRSTAPKCLQYYWYEPQSQILKRIEWLTVRCWKPSLSRQLYGLQQSDIIVVPGAVYFFISLNNTSLLMSLTTTIKHLFAPLSIPLNTHFPSIVFCDYIFSFQIYFHQFQQSLLVHQIFHFLPHTSPDTALFKTSSNFRA